MKTIIIIGGLLIAVAVYAGEAYRTESNIIYSSAQEQLGIKTYKFTDGKVTCYGSVGINGSIVSSQAISCIK